MNYRIFYRISKIIQSTCTKKTHSNENNKVITYALLIDELFDHQDDVIKDSDMYIIDTAKEIATAFLNELNGPQNASHNHISSENEDISW